jgi:hypothetical protein
MGSLWRTGYNHDGPRVWETGSLGQVADPPSGFVIFGAPLPSAKGRRLLTIGPEGMAKIEARTFQPPPLRASQIIHMLIASDGQTGKATVNQRPSAVHLG